MDNKFVNKIREKVQPYFRDQGGHGFDHTQRVYNIAMEISEEENVDNEIVALAVLFHDSARLMEASGECDDHSEEGAKIAEKVLKEENYPEDKIQNIKHCIAVHRYSKKLEPKTKEARILQDADRLEALGAICVARVFTYNGLHKIPLYDPWLEPEKEYHGQHTTAINHFYEKILKIKPETFHTSRAKEIAKGRYDFVVKFLEQFKSEWEGKR